MPAVVCVKSCKNRPPPRLVIPGSATKNSSINGLFSQNYICYKLLFSHFLPRNRLFDDLEVKLTLKMTLNHQNNVIF